MAVIINMFVMDVGNLHSGDSMSFEQLKGMMEMVKKMVQAMTPEQRKEFLAWWTIFTKQIMDACKSWVQYNYQFGQKKKQVTYQE